MNKWIVMGRLTADIEIKNTTSGNAVANFSVAVDRDYCKPGEERQTDFINCQAWRKSAEFIAKYFHKGDMIALEGSGQVRSYEDKENKKRYVTELIVDKAHFCGYKNASSPAEEPGFAPPSAPDFASASMEDELPF